MRTLAILLILAVAIHCQQTASKPTEPTNSSVALSNETNTVYTPDTTTANRKKSPQLAWQRGFHDGNLGWWSNESVASAAADRHGNVVIAGAFWGQITFDNLPPLYSVIAPDISSFPPPTDAYVALLDENGKAVWSRSFGDSQAQSSTAVGFDRDGNILLAGNYEGTISFGDTTFTKTDRYAPAPGFLACLSRRDGSPLWAVSLADLTVPSSGQEIQFISGEQGDDVVLAGNFTSRVRWGDMYATSNGSYDLFVAALGRNRSFRWLKTFGGSSNEILVGAQRNRRGEIILGGYFGRSFSFASGNDAARPMLVDPAGGNIFLAKLSADGEHIWSKSFGDERRQQMQALSVSEAGTIAIAGPFAGTLDFGLGIMTGPKAFNYNSGAIYVATFDDAGNPLWQRKLGQDTGYQIVTGMAYVGDQLHLSGGFQNVLRCDGLEILHTERPYDRGRFYQQYLLGLGAGGSCERLKSLGDYNNIYQYNPVLNMRSFPSGITLIYGGFMGELALGNAGDATLVLSGKDYDPVVALYRTDRAKE